MKKKDIIRTGRQVLEIEAKAVQSLTARLDDEFVAAVELLSRKHNRVIVTGMG